jgi:DNA-binding transcriptional ArsR family regulator
MAQTLGITPSAVSQHLKILRHAGLVRNQRKGFWIPYEVDQTALEQCGEVISNVCRCGCEDSCRVVDQTGGEEINPGEEKLADLKRRERELEEELQKVRTRMEKVREDI